ncbi:MAG: tRNA (adenosine(37)-N6)-dimethylallyltransferase MiaA [Clostridiales bacterium]|jgi:tRNA dimethylallyltransferase|nr:tRNA (adenosine(37)-N6)-dimethylallyltransferase MiaA [Clostridiales bacterium]
MKQRIPLVVVAGPTASGKTDMAIHLAKIFDGEIINADSMQVYKELNIGSAKPSMEERQGVPHHMMDVVSVTNEYTVSQYERQATKAIKDVYNSGKLSIICGGTGLYIRSLLYRMSFSNAISDETIRRELTEYVNKNGKLALHMMLSKVDKKTASRLHPNDVKRVIRALEVYRITGIPFSQQDNNGKFEKKDIYRFILIGLQWPRQELVKRIKKRIEIMVDNGLLDEAKKIYNLYLPSSLPSMQGLGYKQLFSYFDGSCSLEEALEQTFIQTRQFAKRQMTWFRHQEPEMHWIKADEPGAVIQAEQLVSEFISNDSAARRENR